MSPARAILALGLCRRTIRKFTFGVTVDDQYRHCYRPMHGDFTAVRFLTAPNAVQLRAGGDRPSIRRLSQPTTAPPSAGTQTSALDPCEDNQAISYHGPLAQTFRCLKMFSLASLGLTFTMAPFLFLVESSLPVSARMFLTATAISTSSISTALVSWCGAPYVVDLCQLVPAENDKGRDVEGVEMTTLTLTLKTLTTRVYDTDFLVETGRPFATWELPLAIQLPPFEEDDVAARKAGVPGEEETVAETLDDKGEVIGRWIVKWGNGGTGSCRGTGKVLR